MNKLKIVISLQQVLDGFAGDAELMKGFYNIYKKNYFTRMIDIEKSFESLDFDSIYRTVHTLKGSILNFNIPEFSEIAKGYELVAKGRNIEEIKDKYTKFKEACDLLMALLDEKIQD